MVELRHLAERILFGTRLEDKLYAPSELIDTVRGNGIPIPALPGRPQALSFAQKSSRLPFPSQKDCENPQNRGVVLHFFANHELLAIEIMALALLRFPEAPSAFRQGLLATIREEQTHLRLYQEQMRTYGVTLGDVPVNQFFWNSLKNMQDPIDFVIGMSLTFEQANLDFALQFYQMFKELQDNQTAELLHRVYQDEIGHVKHGVHWLRCWKDAEDSLWQAYVKRLAAPLTPARAKGPLFDKEARRRADLDQDFIDNLDVFAGKKGGLWPKLFWYNADCELELAREAPGYSPQLGMRKVMSELMSCMMFRAQNGDVVFTEELPSLHWIQSLRNIGFAIPEFVPIPHEAREIRRYLASRSWDSLVPWGWTPRSLGIAKMIDPEAEKPLPIENHSESFWKNSWMSLFRKSALPELRTELRHDLTGGDQTLWGPEGADGALVKDMTSIFMSISSIHETFDRPAVIKSPYGFAGSGMLRAYPGQTLSESQIGWIEKQLRSYGAVVIEPWLERILDISVVWSPGDEKLHSFVFHTNAKGQYKGHSLQPLSYALPEHLRSFFFSQSDASPSAHELCLELGKKLREKLAAKGYHYAAGIDTMIYRWRDRLYLRVLGEVNCRMTMGHIASGLRRKVSPHQRSLWQTVTVIEAQGRGWKNLSSLASSLEREFPIHFRQGLVESGVFFTNDPSRSNFVLGIVAVGDEAIEACEGMGAFAPTPDSEDLAT